MMSDDTSRLPLLEAVEQAEAIPSAGSGATSDRIQGRVWIADQSRRHGLFGGVLSARLAANKGGGSLRNSLILISADSSEQYAKTLLGELTSLRKHKKGSGAYTRSLKGMPMSEISKSAALLTMARQRLQCSTRRQSDRIDM